jgi:hypothetical protein
LPCGDDIWQGFNTANHKGMLRRPSALFKAALLKAATTGVIRRSIGLPWPSASLRLRWIPR